MSPSEKESVICSSFCVLEGQYFHYLILLCLEVKRLTTNHHVLFFGIHSTYVQAKGKFQCRMFGLLHIVVSPMFFFIIFSFILFYSFLLCFYFFLYLSLTCYLNIHTSIYESLGIYIAFLYAFLYEHVLISIYIYKYIYDQSHRERGEGERKKKMAESW